MNRKKLFLIVQSVLCVLLAVLCFALLWFNLLDPSLQDAKEPAEPVPAADSAEESSESRAPVSCEVGMQLENFTIECLDGSSFRLADTRGKVVFLNLWATYCAPCVKELPHFDALRHEHEGDIAMLAVHSSVVMDDPEEFLADKGWTIPFAVDTEDNLVWGIVNGSSALPQTIVLNREGEVIYNRKGSVTPEMLAALYAQAAGDTEPAETEASVDAVAAGSGAYRVLVTDEDGNPVPGVTVQFCSDVTCVLGKTGEDGVADFAFEPGAYTVHILKTPTGYSADDTEYTAPETPGLVTIVLAKD